MGLTTWSIYTCSVPFGEQGVKWMSRTNAGDFICFSLKQFEHAGLWCVTTNEVLSERMCGPME